MDKGTAHRFDRLFVAVVTPFEENSFDVDEDRLRRLLRYYLQPRYAEAGIAIVINPEAGEVFYLTREEKIRNVRIAVEECRGRVPLFAGAIDLRTDDTVRVAVDAKKEGVDGIFVIPPLGAIDITTSWNAEKYPEVWIDQVKAIDEAVNLPLVAHPVASPSMAYGVGFPRDATVRMCREVPNMVGWKMTYNWDGYRTVGRALRNLDRHVAILGAPAVYFHEALASDLFDGTVTGSFNYALESMIDHIVAWRDGDVKKATAIWNDGLAELHEYIYSDYSRLHVRYKVATWLRGLITHPLMRPPMPRPLRAEVQAIRDLLVKAGLPVIGPEAVLSFTATLKA
ncbi:MAG: dihydrodipicolinate synthase family protein [Deltaproteobacteria bacterium]|nr:dihydrodipicolinate synthase family protein [Deltaproteobacteria bacterium]